ncbi:MAG: histidine--tRNA ligase [Candidatus Marinimicrobia bacterium]|nr:histidine--tRNA ligase [Candidatus Neomarinimicrobiota bacterium]
MKSKFQKVKGTYDILPPESVKWNQLISSLQSLSKSFGFEEIKTPIIENLDLFKQNVGFETDVSKEMFSWEDSSNNYLALKPEMTAPVVRAFIESGFFRSKPLCKLFYIDALFRREKPQKGRQRQFHQFGVEAFGSSEIEQDIEVILIATKVLCHLGIDNTVLQINNIGSKDTRMLYQDKLSKYFTSYKSKLSKISLKRLEINPLRILDSKEEIDLEIIDGAPLITEFLSKDEHSKYLNLLSHLNALNISYQENGRLVRGLDYYNSTTFEISTLSSKSQNALLGGGRYDYLVESMGGPATPAVGFAAGIERLMIESNFTISKERVDFFIGYESQSEKIMSIANQLIDNGYNVFIDTLKKSEKSQIKSAIKLNAKYFLRINDKIILKDLHSKKEFEVNSLNQIKDSIDK